MPQSVIEAVKMGFWNYEPRNVPEEATEATDAIPGSREKLQVLAQRVALGKPLWHPADRLNFESIEG